MSQVRACGVNFGKFKILVFMVPKAQVWTCELRGYEKKKFPQLLDIEVKSLDLWRQFRKNQNYCFYCPKGTEPDLLASRSLKKKKKKRFPKVLEIEVTGLDLWHQFRKNQSFSFYGLKGTVLDL